MLHRLREVQITHHEAGFDTHFRALAQLPWPQPDLAPFCSSLLPRCVAHYARFPDDLPPHVNIYTEVCGSPLGLTSQLDPPWISPEQYPQVNK